jgi:acyl-CoA thioester hydrolase
VGIARIGTTSFTMAMGLFQNDRCVGLSAAVVVHATQAGPAPLPDRWREVLQYKLLRSDGQR